MPDRMKNEGEIFPHSRNSRQADRFHPMLTHMLPTEHQISLLPREKGMDVKSELAEGGGEPRLTECLHCVRPFTQHNELEGAQNSLVMG